jgi:hypothetical protein
VEDYDSFGQSLAGADPGNGTSADLIVGTPDEEVADGVSGAINVLYGSAQGLSPAGNQFWTSASPGIQGSRAQSGEFGAAVAVGAFRGDTSAELALGAPGEADSEGVGALHVITSSATGWSRSATSYGPQAHQRGCRPLLRGDLGCLALTSHGPPMPSWETHGSSVLGQRRPGRTDAVRDHLESKCRRGTTNGRFGWLASGTS